MLQGQGSDEDQHRFQHLWQAVARRELQEVSLEEQFIIQASDHYLAAPGPALCHGHLQPLRRRGDGAPGPG